MSEHRPQPSSALAFVVLLCGLLFSGAAWAQQERHWVGGSGQWNDRAHWSLTANGQGGESVPRGDDNVVIAPANGETVVRMAKAAEVRSLLVDGTRGGVVMQGASDRMRVGGDLVLRGSVTWAGTPTVELTSRELAQLDLHGIPLGGDLRFTGGGVWSMRNDLVLGDGAELELRSGTLVTNGNMLKAGTLAIADRGAKLMAGASVILLAHEFRPGANRDAVDHGSSRLLVNGGQAEWNGGTAQQDERAMNVCATAVGQTPFTIDAQLMSNYNGFGVSCHGVCNGQVRVTVTGGVGPFIYSWIGGPATAMWNNVCPGNQIVIVTDQGQSVSCATTVQVTDPALLSVIFAGTQPPTCAGVCNGSSSVFAVGGVPIYTYSWNNGAGTGASFNQLCAGTNNLHVTDANGCAFDTTFIFPIQPIRPNLTKTDVHCANACDGTAQVAPTGGTGNFTYNWGPGTPSGNGTNAVTGLCAGDYTVTISDANGCDTTLLFTITQPPPILPNTTHVNATCGNTCDGAATVAPTGSAGPFGYSWSPAPGGGQNSATATGLCKGVYTVTIVDITSGCDTVVAITIDAPPEIIPNPTSTNTTCANRCNGTATVAPAGGTPGYGYLWAPAPPAGQNTATASQLCPGTWSVTITDAAGCDTTVRFNITAPPPIVPNASQTNVSCAGACDGTATAPATGGTGTFTYDWQPGNPAGDGTSAVSGLCVGNWSVIITDGNGCDTTLQFLITEPLPLSVTGSRTDVTCGGICDGSATVVASGGTPGHTYLWSPAPPQGQGTATASQLCAGIWSVTVTDANGCAVVRSFTILPAVPIVATVQTTPISCANACDGTATGAVSGGAPPYTYLWSPAPSGGQGSLTATGLCQGPGTFTITDGLGCDTTIAFNIAAPPPIQVASTVTDASCSGTCDGSIALVATGGTGPFTYLWTPASAGTGASAVNLCPGAYQVVVSSGGCDTTLNFTILQPPPIDVALAFTATNCANTCDGTATLTGDLVGLAFVWAPQPGAGQGTASVTGLCAGANTVTITNAAGCDTLIAFTIAAPVPILPDLQVTDASCGTACDGAAVLNVSGSTPGYTYLWTPAPGTGQGTTTVGALCPGNYSVTITDAAGCDTTVQFTISRPTGIVASGAVTPAGCVDICDGQIVMTATGGVGAYTWNWVPVPGAGQGTGMVTGLCPGTWTVTIADQAACDTTLVFHVGSPAAIDPHGAFTNESCNGPCDGTATVAPTGGSGAFTYAWSPVPAFGAGTASVGGLCAGDWCVTVTDIAGCDTTWCFTILPSTPITATVSTVGGGCWNECTGLASVTAAGGMGNFSYLWTPTPAIGQGTANASGLCQGPGTVTVTDQAGCDTTLSFVIFKNQPIQPNLTVYPETCAAACTGEAGVAPIGGSGTFTYLWQPAPGSGSATASDAVGLCAGVNYTLTITDGNGCDTTVAFTVPGFVPIAPVLVPSPATCPATCDGSATVASVTGGIAPYTYFWQPAPANGQGSSHATGMCPGSYQVIVGDANGCDTTLTFVIAAPAPIDPNAGITPIGCGGQCTGTIALVPQGGSGIFTYTWAPAPPVGQGTAIASQLCAGDWTVVIADANGCDTLVTFTLAEPLPIVASADVSPSHCGLCDGAAQLHVSGGNAPYSFLWGPPLNITTTDSLQPALCAGVYPVVVRDASGCGVQVVVAVGDEDGEVITMTDGVTSCPDVCDGTVSVAFNCTDGPCTVEWYDLQGNDYGQSDVATGLCAGSYLAVVTNASGCITIDTAFVTEPAALTANISSTPASCPGSCNGTATIGVVGGVGPFDYAWSPLPGGGPNAPQATGLCPGSYSILVHDQGGCDATFSVLITEPPPITATATVTDIPCSGQCDGAITVSGQGGTGAFDYAWSPVPPSGQNTATASGLCPGTWTVRVSDANGCDTTFSYTLTDPQPLTLSGSSTQSHCAACDGTATVVVSGGSGSFGIQWTRGGATVGAGGTLTGLCAGVYVATVTDAHGCTAMQTVVVPDANGETITAIDGHTTCANSCDGEVSVSYDCVDGPCVVTWFSMAGIQLAQGQNTLSGLCAGSYLVQVVNAAGCAAVDTAHVLPSQVIVANLSTTRVSCRNLCDGTATVGPTGGTAPYTYLWDPAPGGGQNSPHATGLCAGVHQVTITDATGCAIVESVLITAPPPLTVDAQLTQVSCNGTCDGSIVLSPAGGNGFYSYVWSPMPPNGPGSNGAFNLCPGDWSVIVADINGCDTTLNFTITGPDPLTATTSSTLSTCNICNGTASVIPSGGTAPYAFNWLHGGATIGTDSAITDLCAGLYAVQVTDAHGCMVEFPVSISDVGGEAVTTADFNLTCPDNCDGEVTASFICNVPTCSIAWFSAGGIDLNESGNTLSNLCAGSYLVQVTNGDGCITINTASVIAPAPIVANLSTVPVTCAGDCDGTATVGPTGGAGGYDYDWVLGTGTAQGTPTVVGLCAGSYSVTITDQAGCSITQDVLIFSPPPITATAVVVPITCNGADNGSITVMGQGGSGTIQYQWSPEPGTGQGTNTVTGLHAGAWNVTLTDAHGCDTTFALTLTEPPVLAVDPTHTDNTCFNDCVATAHVEVSGGVSPYTITWTGPAGSVIAQNVQDVSGLCGGDHSVTVTDSRGCAVTTTFTVATGAPIEAGLSFLGESCNGPCDGSASVAPTGGTGSGYSYNWQPGNPTGQGTAQVSNLCPGNWTVTIADGAGCDSTYAFTIAPFMPIAVVATVQQVVCNAACDGGIDLAVSGGVGTLTYAWTPDPGTGQGTSSVGQLCPGSWSVTITDGAGCDTTISYSITEPPALTIITDNVVSASCNTANDGAISISITGGVPGYTMEWSGPAGFSSSNEDINALLPGLYEITVTDLNNCGITVPITVGALNAVVADAGPDRVECSDVMIALDATASQGASSYQWSNDQGAVIGTDPVINLGVLSDGTHTYVLHVADGVCADADTLVITVLPQPIADAGEHRSIYVQGTTVLGGSPSGPPGSTFTWQPDSLLDHADMPNPIATVHHTTWFILTVVGPDGCVSLDSVLVTVVPEVKVPSGFTPNGDGHNDTWVLDFATLFPDLEVQVFSRWGEPLFRSVGYAVPWDGKYDGKFVPIGTYYYVIDLHDPRFPEALTGPLTVIR